MSAEDLKVRLRESIQEGEWSWLAPHHERGALVWVSEELDLAEVAAAVATDSVTEVSDWLQKGAVAKPLAAQVEHWSATPGQRFRFLIIQPYVLIQSVAH